VTLYQIGAVQCEIELSEQSRRRQVPLKILDANEIDNQEHAELH
jgi:hypothetical protein